MKAAYRAAGRAKRQITHALPKFWQPKLDASQVLDCKLVHWDLIDRFTSGTADRDDLVDWMETGTTYSVLMQLLAKEGTEFTTEATQAVADQIDTYKSVCERLKNTGRIGFSAPELLTARAAASVFDSLVEMDRHGLAVQAANASHKLSQRVWAKLLD